SDFAQEFTALFEEYEVGVTTESKIVSSFDKLQPILQNLCSEGKGWKKHNLSWEQVDRYKRKHMEHHPLILQMYEQLMMEAKERGWL
ncbi:MAG TPA: HD domain-containing protein, partial [Candidatus Nanoarchaeia archaeon]|nr:HD domain-containing protein [Candidatus Nanoarchaeia archaeon]